MLDPRTGEVLAMADAPGFDANAFGTTPPDVTRNRAVTDVYEPGSTFKLVTVAGVLSDRLVSRRRVRPAAELQVADRVIHDAEQRGTETMSVARILAQSSNIGAVTLAEKLGPTRLYRWMRRFGFGATTRVGFPGESPGFVLKPDGVVGLDDRQRADRPGCRRDAGADGRRLRDDREPRRLDAAASRPARRGRQARPSARRGACSGARSPPS